MATTASGVVFLSQGSPPLVLPWLVVLFLVCKVGLEDVLDLVSRSGVLRYHNSIASVDGRLSCSFLCTGGCDGWRLDLSSVSGCRQSYQLYKPGERAWFCQKPGKSMWDLVQTHLFAYVDDTQTCMHAVRTELSLNLNSIPARGDLF